MLASESQGPNNEKREQTITGCPLTSTQVLSPSPHTQKINELIFEPTSKLTEMDIQNIVKDLQKWQAENKENRSVIIITSECIAKSEGGVNAPAHLS